VSQIIPEKISTRVSLLSAIVVVALLAGGAGIYLVGKRLLTDINRVQTYSEASRNHTLADMAHDGLRAVVYMARSADRIGIDRSTIAKDLQDYQSDLTSNINKNKLLSLSAKTRTDLAKLDKPIEEYISAAAAIVNNTSNNDSSLATEFAAFEYRYRSLEQSLFTAGESIEQESREVRDQAQAFGSRSSILALFIGTLLLGLVMMFSAYVILFMLRPLKRLELSMVGLASGNMDVVIPGLDRKDEIGDMTRAVGVFQSNAIDRARLEKQTEDQRRQAEESRMQAEIERHRQQAESDMSQHQAAFLQTLGAGLSQLARGDLTFRLPHEIDENYRQIRDDFNRMGEQMAKMVGQIGAASNSVHSATHEISMGVSDLSVRTEQQASSLEETAASMEELSATVRQNAGNAQEANRLAAMARLLATGGGEIAGRAVDAMDKIEQSSLKVSEIVGLIQEIAFQTNILALNAAVEAARAGEAGRGFAVVANEVRALAQKSATASKDIKALIAHTGVDVGEGVSLVKQAGSSLTEIASSVRKVADIVSEIAAASQEQASGIDQISRAITNMDEMTQQNAALVEETNAALQSAQHQVADLREAVAVFQMTEREAPRAKAA
jgi:methyl-accepting chemotaxis protein